MKIGNLYNLDAFKTFQDSFGKSGFLDAFGGTVLARNLTSVDPSIFEKKYPELAFVNSGIQFDNTGGYAQRIQSFRVIDVGSFRSAGDESGNGGHISLTAEDNDIKVTERTADSKWTDSQVNSSLLQGINLPARHVETHSKVYMREIDAVGLTGGGLGNEGLLNYSGFTATAAGSAIEAMTSMQMYDAIAGLIVEQRNAVNNTPEYSANRVVMPESVHNVLTATILNSAASSDSVILALQKNFPNVVFTSSFRASNVGGTSAVVAYSNSREAMVMRMPLPLTIGEIVKIGSFNFHMDSKYRIAGLDVLENTAGRILTGL